jgi:hypothetical protein
MLKLLFANIGFVCEGALLQQLSGGSVVDD